MQRDEEVMYAGGKVGSPVPSPTSVLEDDEAWDISSPHGSPTQSSPLPSSSHSYESQTHDMQCRQELGSSSATSSAPKSLVETLQTCLTSLAYTNIATADVSSFVTSPQASDSPAAHQHTSKGAATTTGSKSLGPVATKPTKRRSRSSRRTPTTVLEASCNEFRDMVQKLTGCPAPAPAAGAPKGALNGGHVVRPQPQRATPVTPHTLERREPLPLSAPPSHYGAPPPAQYRTLEFSHPSFLQQLQRSSSDRGPLFPFFSSCKAEELDFASGDLGRATSIPFLCDGPNERSRTLGYTTSRFAADAAEQISEAVDDQICYSQIDSWLRMDQPTEMRV